MNRITHIRVEGLLDSFEHTITFPAEWRYILLYGPNGVGKTKLLELVNAIYACDFSQATDIPFRRLAITHEDASTLTASRHYDDNSDSYNLELKLIRGTASSPLTGNYKDLAERSVRRELIQRTGWRQIGVKLWQDQTDGEIATWDDLSERFTGVFESRRRRNQQDVDIPEGLMTFLGSSPVHLIATQRLLYETPISRSPDYVGRRQPTRQATIAAYSDDLKRRLAKALLDNSKRTQQLDRSFPKRLLEMHQRPIDAGEIRERYEQQNEKRKDLAEIGLINSEIDVPLPDRELNTWELNVLHTYLDDTDEKLRTFEDIEARVSLLRNVVNSRFLNKTLSVSTENGIVITRNSDRKIIPPASLSSGEQHELVLMYDLLFNVPSGALVLIDEPEISLHVAWQKSFIDDIDRIAALTNLQFMIATHSPQIINKSWDRTAELGPKESSDI